MLKTFPTGVTLTVWVLGLILIVTPVVSTVSGQICSQTDEQVSKYIRGVILADRDLYQQRNHIDIWAQTIDLGHPERRTLRMYGFTDDTTDYKWLAEILFGFDCWTGLDKTLFFPSRMLAGPVLKPGVGCAPGTTACGEICVPNGQCLIDTSKYPRFRHKRKHTKRS